MTSSRTPSQTVGPFFAVAIPRVGDEFVVPNGTPGGFWLRGRVTDGAGQPVSDALIETWQLGPNGELPHDAPAGFRGLGRSATDPDGRYAVFTVKPGPPDGPPSGHGRPHIAMFVFARGLLRHLVTRAYFPEDAELADPVLAALDQPAHDTLIARRAADGYELDINLQGDDETVFFEI